MALVWCHAAASHDQGVCGATPQGDELLAMTKEELMELCEDVGPRYCPTPALWPQPQPWPRTQPPITASVTHPHFSLPQATPNNKSTNGITSSKSRTSFLSNMNLPIET